MTRIGEEPPVAVVTDTTHYLPRGMAERLAVHQVSLYVHWSGRSERELQMDGFDAFYERMRTEPELPSTSQPSIGDFLEVWEPLLAAGQDIVSVHVAGGISGTCDTARQARKMLEGRQLADRVTVIDGETVCGGLGLLVLAACSAAREGGTREAVAERVHEARAALKIWFCLDTLDYVRRGGRIGKAQAWLGSTLKIKPILSMESEVTPVERVRTRRRAMERMVRYMHELRERGADGWVVQHIQARRQSEQLVEQGREIFGCDPLFVSEVGPVIGTYGGPGMIGVAGIPRVLCR
ncbi:MAG: DegV family protein [Acidobacteriota bacterium]|nr:DegV family protein [Acidobacteriota bacterium]